MSLHARLKTKSHVARKTSPDTDPPQHKQRGSATQRPRCYAFRINKAHKTQPTNPSLAISDMTKPLTTTPHSKDLVKYFRGRY